MSKLRTYLRHQTWLKRLFLSVVIAAAATYLLTRSILPNQFIVLNHIDDSDIYQAFHDFNNDGYSETLEFHSRSTTDNFIYIKNQDDAIIDQTNYREPIQPRFMMFSDYNDDNYDEIFAFTQRKDSIFLYIHDIVRKNSPINRLLLLSNDQYVIKEHYYSTIYPACIADHSFYSNNVLIFAVRSNSIPAYLPRSVYAYDLDQEKIIREFKTHSGLSHLFMYDLTGDGVDEIILYGSAWGNIHYPAQYRDDRCWLFVLDQKLDPLFEPMSLLEYPAIVTCQPLEVGSDRYLLVLGNYTGEKNIPSLMYMVDNQGKVIMHRPNPFLDFLYFSPAIDYTTNPSEIYGWKGQSRLIKLNHQLEIVREEKTHFKSLRPIFIKDMDADGRQEIFCQSGDDMIAFNTEFDLLARIRDIDLSGFDTEKMLRLTGPNNPIEIGIYDKNDYYHLKFTQNKIYPFIPLIFIGLLFASYLLSTLFSLICVRLNIYLRFFKLSFYNANEGLLIIDPDGKIRYANTILAQLLNLPHQSLKGDLIDENLQLYPQLTEKIKDAIEKKQTIKEVFSFKTKDGQSELNLLVEPLHYFLLSGYSYLVNISAVTPDRSSPKVQTWSRAVQKMAHDIKTPLSTVSLNIKALQTNLQRLTMPEADRHELLDDINMIRNELDTIQNMTKNFIKFANLDTPHFQIFDMSKLIEAAVNKYQSYRSPELEIEVSLDDDLKGVYADPQQIEMVLHILLENALNAVQGRGLIRISASLAQYLDKLFKEYIEIEIADSGAGIPKEDIGRIFEPYFTTKNDGTGMGLAIAKKIIDDHHGTIDVHSKKELGAVFRFSIPVAEEEEQHD